MLTQELLTFFSFFCITLSIIIMSNDKRNKAIKIFTRKSWLINFISIILFIIYIIHSTKENTKENIQTRNALKKAIIAFIIALFTEISLTIAPFWFVFIVAYYLDNWI
jgi:hypothetical protein